MMSTILQGISYALRKEMTKKSAWEWAGILMLGLALVFIGGQSAFGTDFTWDGGGSDALWSNEINWVTDSGYPSTGSDAATLSDPIPRATCVYDLTGSLTLTDLILGGDSPTHMKLNIASGNLDVGTLFTFDPYGELDIDEDRLFAVRVASSAWGSVFIQMEAGAECYLGGFSVQDPDYLSPSGGVTCSMATANHETSLLHASTLTIDADTPSAGGVRDREGFRYYGIANTFVVDNELNVIAGQYCHDYDGEECIDGIRRALLWVDAGTISVKNGGTAVLDIDGGDDLAERRADIAVDSALEADITNFDGGYSVVDVAAGKYLKGGNVTFQVGAVSTKTGSGTVKSGN